MLAEVKKCIETHDIKGLRYIFVDCLDVDPTFEKYKEDYEQCKSVEGLFDTHQPLTGISMDKNDWTMNYWEQLKLDLMKNFSVARFEHMIIVAKVVYADKIARLLSERNIVKENKTGIGNNVIANENNQMMFAHSNAAIKFSDKSTDTHTSNNESPTLLSDEELQKKRLAARRREIEAENQRIEAEQAAQDARIKAALSDSINKQNVAHGETGSKKALGIVLAIIAVVVILIIVMALH